MQPGTVDTVTRHIESVIRKLRKEGTVGMSYANLKQLTPTTGLTCHPTEFHRHFPEIADVVAHRLRFELYH